MWREWASIEARGRQPSGSTASAFILTTRQPSRSEANGSCESTPELALTSSRRAAISWSKARSVNQRGLSVGAADPETPAVFLSEEYWSRKVCVWRISSTNPVRSPLVLATSSDRADEALNSFCDPGAAGQLRVVAADQVPGLGGQPDCVPDGDGGLSPLALGGRLLLRPLARDTLAGRFALRHGRLPSPPQQRTTARGLGISPHRPQRARLPGSRARARRASYWSDWPLSASACELPPL
jgi:hypothetical protein